MYWTLKYGHTDIANLMIDKSKDYGISLNLEDEYLRKNLLKINNKVRSVGGLVFGRRPDLWNLDPVLTSGQIYFPCLLVTKGIILPIVLWLLTMSLFKGLTPCFAKEFTDETERYNQDLPDLLIERLKFFYGQINQHYQNMEGFELEELMKATFATFATFAHFLKALRVKDIAFLLTLPTILYMSYQLSYLALYVVFSEFKNVWAKACKACRRTIYCLPPGHPYLGYFWCPVEVVTDVLLDYFPVTLMTFHILSRLWNVIILSISCCLIIVPGYMGYLWPFLYILALQQWVHSVKSRILSK